MAPRQPRYSTEVHGRMAADMYERLIRPQLESSNQGRVVALDVDSDAYEIADDSSTAVQRLFERFPEAQIMCRRIGSDPAVRHFGFRRNPSTT